MGWAAVRYALLCRGILRIDPIRVNNRHDQSLKRHFSVCRMNFFISRDRTLDFSFSSPDEIARELARRLKAARLAQGLQQPELALRAGLSVGTVKALENKGQSTLSSLIRVVQALGLTQDLQQAFVLQVHSIAQMEQAQQAVRRRAPRRPGAASSSGHKA